MSTDEIEIYDLVIIGSGPGGYHSALRAASYGAHVALIEKSERLGGTCSNLGCIPTKALYASAKMIADLKEKASGFGINLTNGFSTDFSKAVERKNAVVEELTTGIAGLLKIKKVSVFKGFGSLVDGNIANGFRVSVKGNDGVETILKAKRVIVATGSAPAQIPVFNIDHTKILDSDDILKPGFNHVPKTLIVIGGGVIGCEFANIFTEFGSKVTILEFLPTILANEEKPIVKTIKKQFEHLDIQYKVGKNVVSVIATETGVKATVCDASIPRDQVATAEKEVIEAEMCLVSIGRMKVTEGLGLEKFNIALQRGAIPVNRESMETSSAGLYAIGDCVAGYMMLAHVASYQGDLAVMHALASIGGFEGVHAMEADFDTIPATTFTHPNIGSVGLKQKEAKEKYGALLVGRFSYASSGKAKCMGETNGMMMVITDKATDKIVGASCVGEAAPELISEIAVAMRHGITAHQLASVIHSHPTLSEIVLETVEDVHGMAIHKAGRRR